MFGYCTINGRSSLRRCVALCCAAAILVVSACTPALSPDDTASERAAVRLNTEAYSRQGLIDRLVSDGYSTADATAAVDSLSTSWASQAVQVANAHLKYLAYSRKDLIDTLVDYDGFTAAEATEAVDWVSHDPTAFRWVDQAVQVANVHLKYSAYSRKDLIDTLVNSDGFTIGEANEAVNWVAPDWMAQAANEASSYVSYNPAATRANIVNYLVWNKFTYAEASFGATSVGR